MFPDWPSFETVGTMHVTCNSSNSSSRTRAMTDLSVMHHNGWGVTKEDAEAVRRSHGGAEAGDSDSMRSSG